MSKTLHEWLDGSPGSAKRLADHLAVSKSAVSIWRDSGVPIAHMARIVEFSGGEVSIEKMVEHASACRLANAAKRAAHGEVA